MQNSFQNKPKTALSALLASVIIFAGAVIPTSAFAATGQANNVELRDLGGDVTSNSLVTGINSEAGSGIDNIYVSWDSVGTDPIVSEQYPDADPIAAAYFVVTVDGGGFAQCDSSLPSVGTHELAFDETGDVTCHIGGLELDRTVAITVTPFIAAQNDGEVDAMGTAFTTEFTPVVVPSPPTVTATISSAKKIITINWTPGTNSDAITGWRVDTAGLTVDGGGTCTVWDEGFDEENQPIFTDSGTLLDPSAKSCTIPNDNYDSSAAFPIAVKPVYGDSSLEGPFGATFIGAKTAADPGFITNFSVETTGAKAAKISWKIYGMSGASAITSQTVSAYDPADTSDEPKALDKCVALKVTDRTCTLTKLVAGKNYQIIVSAENENGVIDNSSYPWTSYTQPVAPESPTDFTATDDGTQLVFDWNPGWNGGSELTKYTLTEVGSTTPVCGTIPGTANSCVFTGTSLTKLNYNFELMASNGASFTEPVTAEFVPVFPEAVSDIAVSITGKGTADVTWTSALDAATYEVTVNGKIVVCPEIQDPGTGDGQDAQIDPNVDPNVDPNENPNEDPTVDQNICSISDLVSKKTYTIGVKSVRWNAKSAITTTSYVHPSGPTIGATLYEIGANGRSAIIEATLVNANSSLATSFEITTRDLVDNSVVDTQECTESLCVVEGLLPSHRYLISVVGTNLAGSSSPQSVIASMPSPPSFPRNVSVEATAQTTAQVTWKLVERADSYIVSVTHNGYTQTYDAQNNSATIDVESTQSYSISVVAINLVGQSLDSAISNYVHPLAPAAPTVIRAFSESLTSALMTWNASDTKNGGPVDTYSLDAYLNGELVSSCQPTKATTCLLSGLEHRTYDIRVSAKNVIGESPVTNLSYLVPSAPAAPKVSAEALRNGQWKSAKISWRVTDTGGLPIKSVIVSATSEQEIVMIEGSCLSVSVTSSDCVLTGLTAGNKYVVSVAISNSAGQASSETAVTIPSIPKPVTNILASQTDEDSANIVWTKSQNADSYTVKVLDIAGNAVNCVGGNITYQPTCLLDGLNSGETNSISVVANLKGVGTSIEGISSYSLPDFAPTYQVSALPDAVDPLLLNLYFKALDSSGSSIFPRPSVTVYTHYGTTDVLRCTTTPFGATCAFDVPLEPGDIVRGTYSITAMGVKTNVQKIRSIRSVVAPPAEDSGSFNFVIPLPPEEVTNLDVAATSSTTATVTWDSVDDSSVAYDVTVDGNLICEGIKDATCEITNELGAQSVLVSVTAKNVAGDANPVTFDYIAPVLPEAPDNIVSEVNSSGSSLTSWSTGSNTPDTKYSVELDGEKISDCTDLVNPVCLVSDLVPGGEYIITVTAKNVMGSAQTGAFIVQPVPATAPVVQAEVSDDGTSIHLSWTALDFGGAKPTGIEIRLNPSEGTTGCADLEISATSCDLEGLAPGINYTFAVRLITDIGAGSFGFASVTTSGTLDSPTNVSISHLSDTKAAITWDALENVSSYLVYVNGEYNDVCSTEIVGCTIDIDTTKPITVMVSGNNVFGASALTKFARAGRSIVAPNHVVAVSSADGRSISLSWKASITPVSQEVDYASESGISGCTDLGATDTSCTVTGLTPGSSYSFVLRAYDEASVLNESEITADTKLLPTPKAASGLAVALVKKVATLTWTSSVAQISSKAALPTYSVTLNGKLVKCKVDAASPSCALGKLAATTKYAVKVTATLGSKSVSSKEFKFTAKTAATVGFLATKTSATGTTLTWQDLAKLKASAITVAVSPKAIGCKTVKITAKNCVLTGLVAGTSYNATVTIKHAKGASTKMVRNFVAPPALSAPADLDVQLTGNHQARVWITPGFDSVGNTYVCSSTNSGITVTFDSATTSCLLSNVNSANVATVSVYAKNGTSKSSAKSVTWTAPTAPRAVSELEATIKSGFVTVSWLPNTSGNQNITGYRISSAKSTSVEVGATTFSAKIAINTVTPGSDVTFTVVALSQVGDSPSANVVTTALGLPTAVESGSVDGDWTSASTAEISWQGVEAIADYRVSISTSGSSARLVCETHATVCLLTGLTKNMDYTVTITSTNEAGSSVADAVIWHHGSSADDSEMTNP